MEFSSPADSDEHLLAWRERFPVDLSILSRAIRTDGDLHELCKPQDLRNMQMTTYCLHENMYVILFLFTMISG